MLSDPQQTPSWEKGQGIQSTALFASFLWITKREEEAGYVPFWLIEEPESYLHPELSKACEDLLDTLATHSLVVLTTHSLTFVPPDIKRIQGVDLDDTARTTVSSFVSHTDATATIRNALGIHFSDYYNLANTNIFVEGPSYAALIPWAAALCGGATEFPLISASFIQDFGGVKQLEGFLRAVWEPISKERALVSVFDGDDAGHKSRQALQQFFRQKNIGFRPNEHYVSIRSGFAVEGLFPDAWLVEIEKEHPSWFESFSVDSAGDVEPFNTKSSYKAQVIRNLQGRAEAEEAAAWNSRWLGVLNAIETALEKQLASIEANKSASLADSNETVPRGHD